MANTVQDIIYEAFEDLGVTAVGETVSNAIRDRAFTVLQQMYASWSLEQATVNTVKHQTLTLTAGTSLYTFGTGGTLVATATPVRVTGAASVSGSFRQSCKVVSHEEFAASIDDPIASRSVLAKVVAADNAFPNINLRVFPVPDTSPGSLLLDYWSVLVAFAAVTDTLALAPGYEHALHYNLAVALAPQYAREKGITAELAAMAQSSKAAIVALNASILGLQQAPAA